MAHGYGKDHFVESDKTVGGAKKADLVGALAYVDVHILSVGSTQPRLSDSGIHGTK